MNNSSFNNQTEGVLQAHLIQSFKKDSLEGTEFPLKLNSTANKKNLPQMAIFEAKLCSSAGTTSNDTFVRDLPKQAAADGNYEGL